MADLEWDYAYIDLASSEKESHEWNEGQKHDARIIVMGCRRENSVNMNLEVEDPLYAKVQRRGSSVSRQQQGSLICDVRRGCVEGYPKSTHCTGCLIWLRTLVYARWLHKVLWGAIQ